MLQIRNKQSVCETCEHSRQKIATNSGVNPNHAEKSFEIQLQTRGYAFSLSNPGLVNAVYAWKIDMDEQFPKRGLGDGQNVTIKSRIADDSQSRQCTKSSRGIPSATSEFHRPKHNGDEKYTKDSPNYCSQQCTSFATGNSIWGASSVRASRTISFEKYVEL